MILQLNRVIRGWERSGQGDGGITDDEVDNEDGEENEVDDTPAHECEFGSLKNCLQLALNNQKYFVEGKSSYLLYLWELLDEHDLAGSSMQRLNDDVCSGNGNNRVPSVVGKKLSVDVNNTLNNSKGSSKKSQKSEIAALTHSINNHGESLIKAARIKALQQEKDQVMTLASL